MFAAMNDVAGKAAEAEREFAAEIEKSADEDEETAEEQENATEFAEGIHITIIEERPSGRANVKLPWTSEN